MTAGGRRERGDGEAGGDEALAATSVVVSTALSIVSLSVVLALV